MIMDSLKKQYKNDFLKEVNGYISVYRNGLVIKELNYGNYATKFKNLDFDGLSYKLSSDTLKIISDNGNNLIHQKEGVFFIPSPGYDIIRKYSKKRVLKIIDSVYRLSEKPDKIKIREN